MIFYHKRFPSEFPQNSCAVFLGFRHIGSGITVDIVEITNAPICPSAGAVYKPGGIQAFCKISNCFCLELSPPLIEWHPCNNRTMIVELFYPIFELLDRKSVV